MQPNGTSSHMANHARSYKQTNSYASSSGDSYGGTHIHSRSASGTSETHYDEFIQTPPSKTLMHEYTRPEVVMGGVPAQDTGNPQTSRASIYNDPMALHLLVETALGESQHFDILSLEDLEKLRKEQAVIARRVESGKRRLFLETRVHNTAQSLQRLDSRSGESTSPNSSKRRSLLGFRSQASRDESSNSQNSHPVLPERKKCEEIAKEIWKLENRQRDLREKMLRHTAGVLQLNQQTQVQNEQPKSPDLDVDLEAQVLSLPQGFGKEQEVRSQLHDLGSFLYDVIQGSGMRSEPEYPPPGQEDASISDQVAYLQEGLNTVGELHRELLRYVQKSQEQERSQDQHSKQTDAVLSGLWEILGSGQADVKQRRKEIRKLSMDEGERSLNDYGSDDDDGDAPIEEPFSLQAFSAKVQWLCNQASTMSEQHLSYKDQMRQEREASRQANAARGEERTRLIEQLQEAHDQHLVGQRALQEAQSNLMDSRSQLSQAQQEISFTKQQRDLQNTEALEAQSAELRTLRDQISTHEASLTSLQAANADAGNKLQEAETQMAGLHASLREAESRAAAQDASVQEKAQHIESFATERAGLESEVARLQTELTVAKAELDGAYGTRAERAAEVAGSAETQKELEEMTAKHAETQSRIEILQKELSELVTEYESMVKQSVDAEKERETLEGTIDSLRERAEGLELKLSEERVKAMGRRAGSKESNENATGETGTRPRAAEGASTTVMRNEFKKMMREARAEHFKTLRAEQEERRKLEATIRTLKKEQGPMRNSSPSSTPIGKSNLSSVTAA